MIKKLVGSVVDVFRRQGHPEAQVDENKKNKGVETNRGVIAVDLGRTALVDFSGKTHSDFVSECSEEKVFKEQYAQGNLDGGAAVEAYLLHFTSKVQAMSDEAELLTEGSTAKKSKIKEAEALLMSSADVQRSLRFAYRDNDGKLCGFGLVFTVDKPDNWVLQIVRDTIAPIDSRATTLLAQGDIVNASTSTTVDAATLSEEIKTALNNPLVNELISGLIDETTKVSLQKFNELTRLIRPGRNIDPQVEEYIKRLFDFEGHLRSLQKSTMTDAEKRFHSQGGILLQIIRSIVANDPGALESEKLAELNKLLDCSSKAITEPKNKENRAQLVALSQTVSGASPKWRALGVALLVFAGLALIVAGVLAAIPSGGSSLLLTIAGAAGVSAGITAAAGYGFFSYNSQKGLAKSVSDFNAAVVVPS